MWPKCGVWDHGKFDSKNFSTVKIALEKRVVQDLYSCSYLKRLLASSIFCKEFCKGVKEAGVQLHIRYATLVKEEGQENFQDHEFLPSFSP